MRVWWVTLLWPQSLSSLSTKHCITPPNAPLSSFFSCAGSCSVCCRIIISHLHLQSTRSDTCFSLNHKHHDTLCIQSWQVILLVVLLAVVVVVVYKWDDSAGSVQNDDDHTCKKIRMTSWSRLMTCSPSSFIVHLQSAAHHCDDHCCWQSFHSVALLLQTTAKLYIQLLLANSSSSVLVLLLVLAWGIVNSLHWSTSVTFQQLEESQTSWYLSVYSIFGGPTSSTTSYNSTSFDFELLL